MNYSLSPMVGVIMGSSSDWNVMSHAASILESFEIPFESKVISAHRMPKEMFDYASEAHNRGLKAIIAGAGGAAHLPGMIAALTEVPVFGVPVPSKYLSGEDSLLSIVQMPKGIPVATFAIGEAGAVNAALHVLANMALFDNELRCKLLSFRESQTDKARNMKL
ncbi:5-(carboxyamino)imidazole ribonucleotide mutase [Candidatus Kinetoplastibacterium blastocrithidii TCC012E]|uniref:N5-carboxyaminoimidazole ribonucleotide mutase n=1 Tax=Candidatus Kinetoplastidibacterium blastocrithidiae TCC012E TaxID=1208922 RepID=M1LAS1_9PROT|nr:5-(carboxyamino)imidazole ribonucleotide mutase [Candidatus Kinetoplastibacterium blastocrithidii]AGF49578.1 5-(carboxyamino)imidazole ribonucleotide mutase [Candidatus Kinetoplastibacterium blastocrithidii TCC012E]